MPGGKVLDQFGRPVTGEEEMQPMQAVGLPKASDDLPLREDANYSLDNVDTCKMGKCTIPARRPQPLERDAKISRLPLFKFPLNVNDVTIRIVGFQAMTISILGIIFRDERTMHYIIAGLCMDYALRMYGGARISVLGMIAEIVANYFPRKLAPGPPKQFASLCGLMFSGIAFICFFEGEETGGAIVLGMLAGAAFCESILNFCFGCFIFHFLRKFGLVHDTVQGKAFAAFPDIAYSLDEDDTRANIPPPVHQTRPFVAGEQSKADMTYIVKQEDHIRDIFHPVRYMHIHYFAMVLAINGLAVAWKASDDANTLDTVEGFHETLALAAGILFGVFSLLYLAKMITCPKKVRKEWQHPIVGNMFSLIPINIVLFAFHSLEEEPDLATVLFWIAAPLQILHSVMIMSNWHVRRRILHMVDASYMIPVLGNFVVALVAPLVYSPEWEWDAGRFTEFGWLPFSMAMFMLFPLVSLVLLRSLTQEPIDQKLKPGYALYVGAPAVACIAYVNLNGFVWDNFALFLYFSGWGMFLVLVWMSWSRFFGKPAFNMADWTYVFPLAAHAAAALNYYALNSTENNREFALLAFAVCNGIGAILLLLTVFSLLKRRNIFTAERKWGPLSFMKLTHEAFRGSVSDLVKATYRLNGSVDRIKDLHRRFKQFAIVHDLHARYEDDVIYKYIEYMFPGHARKSMEEHKQGLALQNRILNALDRMMQGIPESDWDQAYAEFERMMGVFLNEYLEHMSYEEDHLSMVRKYIAIETQVQLVNRCIDATSTEEFIEFFAFHMEHMPTYPQRVTFLKCFRWAAPDKIQHLGRCLYHKTDGYMWDRIARDVPEIIPRNLPGNVRYF